jgi:transposase
MRGKNQDQSAFLTVLNPNDRIPAGHPIRGIKRFCDEALARLSPVFDELYALDGRPSIPPEQLLKARVLMALFSVRSERSFCEQLQWNMLWMWFLNRDVEDGSWAPTVFTKNLDRVLSQEVAQLFFRAVYDQSREEGWCSDEHFSADGTLLEAWASKKSFVRKDGGDEEKVKRAKDEDPGNPSVDFRGQKRRNDTHQSTTDPDSVLYRKSSGQESRLSYGFHVLMENRNGLMAEVNLHNPIAQSEDQVASEQLRRRERDSGVRPRTVGADKNYHNRRFVTECRAQGIRPHVAQVKNRKVKGLDGRTIRQAGYAVSMRIRKRIEEGFGWLKTVAGLRRTRHRGTARVGAWATFMAAACNLVRMANLAAQPAPEMA